PFAAYQFALHGADVIHVEEPVRGDGARHTGGPNAAHLIDAAMGHGFLAHGANKRSLTLNLQEPAGQEIFRKLARDADVVIENLKAGTMDRYGLGYAALSQINPRLVFASFTGFGQDGPRRDAP